MALAQLTRFQADSVSKLGQTYAPIDKVVGGESNYPAGIYQLGYTVPANNRFRAKAMTVSIRPDILTASVLNTPNGRGGIAFISVAGTVVDERAFYGFASDAYFGSDEQQDPFQNQNGSPSFGEGVTVNAGQAILISCTPRQETLQVWRVTILGRLGSTPDIRTAVVSTYLTTDNQTLLSYTPASDYTLLGVTIEAEQPGHIFGGLQLDVNGLKTFEAGYVGVEGGTVSFMDDKSYAGPAQGCLMFPLWGMTFGEGDRFGFSPSAHSDHGMHMTYSIFGTEEVIGGGGSTGATCFAF